MDVHAAERLLSLLEAAIQKLTDAHRIALLEADFRKLYAFHETCATIEAMIDQNLIAPLLDQYPDLKNHFPDIPETDDSPGYEVREWKR